MEYIFFSFCTAEKFENFHFGFRFYYYYFNDESQIKINKCFDFL